MSSTQPVQPTATGVPTEPAPEPLQSAYYMYEGDNLVKSIINGKSTYYLGKLFQKKIDGTEETIMKYYSSGSAQIAMRSIQGESDTLQWLLSDHLGSTSTTANADGTWNSTISYTAFGEIRTSSGITPTEFRYTGQLRQAELGLYYYVARWYDPYLNHFVQADTIVPNAGDSAAYDRYAYTRNNPIKYSDPTGHDVGRGSSIYMRDELFPINKSPALTRVTNYYYGSWYGQYPDYRGVDTAKKNVEKTKSGSSTVTAAAIAVQSQYYLGGAEDFVTRHITKGGLGIAQISDEQMKVLVPGGDPTKLADAVRAMEMRLENGAAACINCNDTDKLIAMMVSQNGPGVDPRDISSLKWVGDIKIPGRYKDWSKYFDLRNLSDNPILNDRAGNNYQYDTRFMVRLMYNDIFELHNQGWVLPEGINWQVIHEYAFGGL